MLIELHDLPHQREAVASVVDCFFGQHHASASRREDVVANPELAIAPERILANVRAVQARSGLEPSTALSPSAIAPVNLDVEMETGTGKTYTYVRTMFELHRRYGWSKYVVVVPSIAIREGVARTFETTAAHFFERYGRKIRAFTYDSRELESLARFASDAEMGAMIINMQAFNARGEEARRFHLELDALQSRRPVDLVRATRPILVLDEPQKIEGEATTARLAELGALFALRYSATHRTEHDLVHRLDALDAYRKKLVKRIAVRGITAVGGDGGGALEGDGLRRVQIREAIRAHLDKERALFPRGIKVLSLFFLDEVARYRTYEGKKAIPGEDARIFEEEYSRELAERIDGEEEVYSDYLRSIPPQRTHAGYFSIDPKTKRMVNPRTRGRGREDGESDDVDAYDLILRDKTRLLDLREPVRFVFSHSALREGWDNPNVFVIATLKDAGGHPISRRQEIGRGLRLAVDRHGRRQDDPRNVHDINVLTVVARESVRAFAAGLQSELRPILARRSGGGDTPELPVVEDAPMQVSSLPARPPTRSAAGLDTRALVARVVRALDVRLEVRGLAYEVGTAHGEVGSAETGSFGWADDGARRAHLEISPSASAPRDLLEELAARTHLTRRTLAEILTRVRPETFARVRVDPETFVLRASAIVLEELDRMVDGPRDGEP